MDLPPYIFVDTPDAWESCLQALSRESRIAVDLESNSLYAYRESICLLQCSTPLQDYIVDPLAGFGLEGFEAILADPAVEKTFHAGEYDLILLTRQFGWQTANYFDTMWAARILGYQQMGLANFIEEFFDLRLSKRLQKSNWCRRPLTAQQLRYAQADTHFLLRLRDIFHARLEQAGRLDEALEIFAEQSDVTIPDTAFDAEGYWTVKGARELTPRERAVLRALYVYRDKLAHRLDRPPFKVMGNAALVELAQRKPRRMRDLAGMQHLSELQVTRMGAEILGVIKEALAGPAASPRARKQAPPDAVLQRHERLKEWRKRHAEKRGVAPDVVLHKDTLWTIAYANPQDISALAALDGIGPWRLRAYGVEILTLLRGAVSDNIGRG
jgi:ribonuclease D